MEHKLIVFDGVCVLCTRWLRFVLQHDRSAAFRFASMQSPAGRHLLQQHGLSPEDPLSFLVLADGRHYSDTDAVIRVVTEFGGSWRAVKALRVIPRAIRDPAYRLIARHRYRLFGKRNSCMVPCPDVAARFVDRLTDLESLCTNR